MKQTPMKIGIIIGGQSSEHSVSLTSGNCIIDAIDDNLYEITPFGINLEGLWLNIEETQNRLKEFMHGERDSLGTDSGKHLLNSPEILSALGEMDAIFPIIHGTNGEDGKLQGFLDLVGIPYVGAGVAASALGMDKALMRNNFESAGIPQPKYLIFSNNDQEHLDDNITKQIEKNIGYPCFIKPCNGGSSIGVSKVLSREDLGSAWGLAKQYDQKVIIEEIMRGRELECAVIGNNSLLVSGVAEIRTSEEFYTYSAKYSDSSTELILPADIKSETLQKIQNYAINAFQAIDCSGLARVDFIADEISEPKIIEINTLPGFTPQSMFPRLWEAEGITYSELITKLIDLAFEKHSSERLEN
tara:strand:- start:2177 stop:3250 length:1074 start_codon:yes stop_codon:yes gene_type:complete